MSALVDLIKGIAVMGSREDSPVLGSSKGIVNLSHLLSAGFGGKSVRALFKGEMQGGLTEDEMVNLYGNYVWVYRCVKIIATTVARLPVQVFENVEKTDFVPSGNQPTDEGYPVELLKRPNPRMSMYDIHEYITSSLQLAGESYTEIVRVDDNDPISPVIGLYPWQPQRFTIGVNRQGQVAEYLYEVSPGKVFRFPPHKIMHIKLYNPLDDYHGMSPLNAARRAISTDRAAIRLNEGFLKNNARPLGVLELKRRITKEQRRDIREEWENVYGGSNTQSGAGRIAILGHDATFRDIGIAPADAQFLESRKMSRDEVALIYGVPLMKVGEDVSGVRTAEAQEREYYHETIVPLTIKIMTALNRVLLLDNGIENRFIDFDYSVVGVLQEDQLSRAERHRTYVQTGVMTINEARREIGLPPVPWGNIFFQPLNVAPIGFDPANLPPKKPRVSPTGDEIEQSYGGDLQKQMAGIESRIQIEMSRYFVKAMKKHEREQRNNGKDGRRAIGG